MIKNTISTIAIVLLIGSIIYIINLQNSIVKIEKKLKVANDSITILKAHICEKKIHEVIKDKIKYIHAKVDYKILRDSITVMQLDSAESAKKLVRLLDEDWVDFK